MPSKKKRYNTRFPPARIKKIMQADEEVGKVAAAVPVIISRALELFLESLVKTSGSVTTSRNAKTLTTSHVKSCVLAHENLHFLKSLVDTYPDVQVEEEFTSSCSFEGQIPSNNTYHTGSTRGRRPRAGIADAGPSQSTADESETWSAEDEEVESDVGILEDPECIEPATSCTGSPASPDVEPSTSGVCISEIPMNNNEQKTDRDLLLLACQKLDSVRCEDEFDSFGKYIAAKFRKMNENQAAIAEKLLGELMYAGLKGCLSDSSRIVTNKD